MPENKISSLHDDLAHPLSRGLEYDRKRGYPHKYDQPGENGENTIIHRVAQFGVTADDLRELGVDNLFEINNQQYERLMLEVLRRQYDTVFASVYGRWVDLDLPGQQALVKKMSKMYRRWGIKLDKPGDSDPEAKPNLLISLEGADFVRSLDDVEVIAKSGIKSVMPQYNRPNALGDQNGLTDLGSKFVAELLRRGLAVDLAHSMPAVRANILDSAQALGAMNLITYSHGASVEDLAQDSYFSAAAAARGLQDQEITRIISGGGIVGLGVSRPFFQSLDHVAEAIDKICQKEHGPNSIGLGTDFGGVSPALLVDGISSVEDLVKIGEVLSARFGHSDSQVNNILRNNVAEWSKKLV